MARLPLAACAALATQFFLLASSSSATTSAGRDGRTAYHFQPAKNWQNSPNGPMYYNGLYHLFYEYNPHGALWDLGIPLSWGHSVSGDLVNWATLENSLEPTAPFDIKGCWSGSTAILPDGTPVIIYTGTDANESMAQNVAFPKNPADPLLRDWVKPDYNPVIPLPADVPGGKFCDPSTPWLGRDGLWRVLVAAEVDGVGSTLVYRTNQTSFRGWVRNPAPLHSSKAAGMVENPDLFPVNARGEDDGLDTSANGPGVKHVFKVGVMDTLEDYYMVGEYDEGTDAFRPEEPERGDDVRGWRRVDYGHLYSTRTFFDAPNNRRVLWAWVNESDSQADDFARGWSGVQVFPRKVWLDKENGKQLLQWPIEEIKSLRKTPVCVKKTVLNAGAVKEIVGVGGSQVDVEVSFRIQSLESAEVFKDANELMDTQRLCLEKGAAVAGGVGPFGLIVAASADLREHTAVFFRVFKYNATYKLLMCTDLTKSSTRAGVYKGAYGGFLDIQEEEHKKIELRTLVDHTMLESFGAGGRTVITARVYPENTATNSSHLFVFNNGSDAVRVSKLQAWELAPASVNVVDNGLLRASQASQ